MRKKPVLFGLLPAAAITTALVLSPLEVVTEAQQQAPAGPAPAATGRAGGRGLGGGRGGGPSMTPSALRAIPAETMYSGGQVEGRQPVRELGGAR